MSSRNVCWGIEIGAGAIKALKLERDGSGAKVTDFLSIPHAKVLSTPDLDPSDAMRVALGTLVSQRDLSGATIAVSVPGHAAFARFAKLPPVEPKKIPDIVKFEAVQQIPFPIEEVEWDYQTFVSEDSPEVEVGIFAITRQRVMEKIAQLQDVGIRPDCVALSPVAVYNALAYDLSFTEQTPGTVIVDIGTTSTDLIVAEAGRVWIRTFPIGGHAFTECIATAFKLPYTKAEKLKREVEQSKHRKHVFQAMKSVFDDLAQDIQRSIAYYQQLHPDAELSRMVGLGSTFQLPGLRKFLSQRLQLDVIKLEQFQQISVEGPESAEFQAAAMNLCTAYGCALQGLDMTPIAANLVPVSVVREAMWKRKRPWFAVAAVLSLLAGAATFVRPTLDRAALPEPQAEAQRVVSQVKRRGDELRSEWDAAKSAVRIGHSIQNYAGLLAGREVMAQLSQDLAAMLASGDPQDSLRDGRRPDAPPSEWRFFSLQSFVVEPVSSGSSGGDTRGGRAGRGRGRSAQDDDFGAEPAAGGPSVATLNAVLTVDSAHRDEIGFVSSTLVKWLVDNAQREGAPYTIVPPSPDAVTRTLISGGSDAGAPGQANDPGRRAAPPTSSGVPQVAAPSNISSSLEQLAPLREPDAGFPQGATVYRYVIPFKIEIAPPTSPVVDAIAAAQPADGAEAQQ